MKYVYLVYEDCYGLVGIYGTSEDATKCVKQDVLERRPKLLNKPLDYNSQWRWGWKGVAHWEREQVL